MVCGSLIVDSQDRWCELHGNQLRIFKDRPDVVLQVPKGGIMEVSDRSWVLDGCTFNAKCISDKKYWVECLERACSDEMEELRAREIVVEKKEVALMWREHSMQVSENTTFRRGGSSTPSWGISTEGHSRGPSPSLSPQNRRTAKEVELQGQVTELEAKVDELKKWIASVQESPQRVAPQTEGVLPFAATDIQSGIEVLDSPSPVKAVPTLLSQPVTPVKGKLTPRTPRKGLVKTPKTGKALGRVTLEVPGKVVTLTPDKLTGVIALHVNDEHLGGLTWLGYDSQRRWLTTGTGSTRAGVAVPDGAEGKIVLKKLSTMADAMGVEHNLPSSKLSIGDEVQTVKFLKFPSGRQIPMGTKAKVVHITKTGQVRVKTGNGDLFTTATTTLESAGSSTQAPRDSKIAAYIAANLTDDKQQELRTLDSELDTIMQLTEELM
eukprot:TRINITY_DN37134_c0_g1_i1.p1 TRINITY_DN37134_c0_g1~~TRINITY_DN37134_c0_g1_i1.p1  ORF type:complete len:436 (+),score=130.37 TRINITY_DN37134_c0_g1_i1:53-1360(+)